MNKRNLALVMLAFLVIPILIGLFAAPYALAEDAGTAGTDVADYMTPVQMATFAGQVTFVLLVVQFLKLQLDKVWKIRTEYFVNVIAIVSQALTQALAEGFGSFTWVFIPKCLVYALLVSVVAMKTYEKAIKDIEEKKAAIAAAQAGAKPPNAGAV